MGSCLSTVCRKTKKELSTMPVRFVHVANGQLPPNAFAGGHDNGPQYVARCYHEGNRVPGKFVPAHGVAYIPWGGKEHAKTQYEVLVQDGPDNLVWVPASHGGTGGTGALMSGRLQQAVLCMLGELKSMEHGPWEKLIQITRPVMCLTVERSIQFLIIKFFVSETWNFNL